ncbi:endonuclease domain-containing protein [Streptomyces sp. NPDC086023]|uniref:endonuclease domain-containing protein n=1 Tax=Streptomyces sp. NPDC086023 TaxID=3365746 RepID=UPI0037D12F23
MQGRGGRSRPRARGCPRAPRGHRAGRTVRPDAIPDHVDRDHRTGKVRGVTLLQLQCRIGQFKDRPDVTRRAAAYVEGNLWKPTFTAQGVCRQPS